MLLIEKIIAFIFLMQKTYLIVEFYLKTPTFFLVFPT